jgi:hypothetical protein
MKKFEFVRMLHDQLITSSNDFFLSLSKRFRIESQNCQDVNENLREWISHIRNIDRTQWIRLAMIRFRTEPTGSVLTFEIKPNRIESSEIKSLKFRFDSVSVDLKPTGTDAKTVQKVTLDLIFNMWS